MSAVILSGAALRFVKLARKPFWFNEAFTALRVSGYDEHDHANPSLFTGRPVSRADIQTFQRASGDTSILDTVRGLARKEPQLPPAYFVVARLAAQSLGDGHIIAATRGVSAVCGALSILAMYWLALEWSGQLAVAWLSAGLLAVSPLFIRYAQEARPYSMWALLVLLACAAFLRMSRTPGRRIAAAYALLTALALYTQPLTLLVIAAHALFVFLGRFPARASRLCAAAFVTALAAFLPWVAILAVKAEPLLASTAHLASPMPTDALQRLAHSVAAVFIAWPSVGPEAFFLAALVLLWALYVFRDLRRSAPHRTWLSVLLLGVIPAGLFILWDAAAGGQRSSRVRYMLPAFLPALLASAHVIVRKISHSAGVRSYLWRGLAAAILLAGLVSSAFSVRAETWWGQSQVEVDVGRILNRTPRPLVISDRSFGEIAALSHQVDSHVSFLLVGRTVSLAVPEGYDPVFVYQPSDRLLQAVQDRLATGLRLVYRSARWDGAVSSLYRAEWEHNVDE
ncbi:MAG: glycosyltransferase family 39 protein [Bryobacteraceae bacterium]|nr:glycosyltransferase family 39 protein [Bryobacteraceae bacterium]